MTSGLFNQRAPLKQERKHGNASCNTFRVLHGAQNSFTEKYNKHCKNESLNMRKKWNRSYEVKFDKFSHGANYCSWDCQPLWLVRQKKYNSALPLRSLSVPLWFWRPRGGGRILWGRQTFLKRPFWVFKQLISPANRASPLQPLPGNKLPPPSPSFRSLIITLFARLSNTFLMLLWLIKMTLLASEEQVCFFPFLSRRNSIVRKKVK